eukprot:3704130-Pyramimonas_sp.AAC.1
MALTSAEMKQLMASLSKELCTNMASAQEATDRNEFMCPVKQRFDYRIFTDAWRRRATTTSRG